MRSSLAMASLTASLLVALDARAQTAEAEARKAFEAGMATEASDPRAACVHFRRALELTRELGPLKKAKECDAREGKLLDALAKLDELVRRWPQPDATLESLKAEGPALRGRLAHLQLTLEPGAPAGVAARVDGAAVSLPASDLPLDPGAHELLVEVPGRPLQRVALDLAESERRAVRVPSTDAAPPRAAESGGGLGALGVSGLIIGGVGVGGLIGGAITGGLVLSKQSEFEECRDQGTPAGCDVLALKDSGDQLLTANAALFIAGGALAAVGATLFIVDVATSSDATAAKSVGLRVRGSGLSLEGTF